MDGYLNLPQSQKMQVCDIDKILDNSVYEVVVAAVVVVVLFVVFDFYYVSGAWACDEASALVHASWAIRVCRVS